MNGFYTGLAAIREVLEASESAFQTAAVTRYGRGAPVWVDKVPRELSAAVAAGLLQAGDEDLPANPADRVALATRALRCVRVVSFSVLVPKGETFGADLDALITAAIDDLHRQPVAGVRRIDYAGGGPDELPGNAALWTALFQVLYDR